MADIDKITASNGTTYNIKDATARDSISQHFTQTKISKNTSATFSGINADRAALLVISRRSVGLGAVLVFDYYTSTATVLGDLPNTITYEKEASSESVTVTNGASGVINALFIV